MYAFYQYVFKEINNKFNLNITSLNVFPNDVMY